MVLAEFWDRVRSQLHGLDRQRKSRRRRHRIPEDAAGVFREFESLEDRALLDGGGMPNPGDPYGGSGGTGGPTPPPPPGGGGGIGGGGSTGGTFMGAVTGGFLRPNGQQWFETFGTDPLSGVVAVSRDLPGNLRLSYSADTVSPKPIVAINSTWALSTAPTGPLTAQLVINGVTHSSVVIDHAGIQQGTPIRIALQATTALPAGRYDAQIQMTAPNGMYSLTQTLTQKVLVEDRTSSPFGSGWTIAGLESLTFQTGGTVYNSGSGYREWFSSGGMPDPGGMSMSALIQNANGTWTLSNKDGSQSHFDAMGRLTSRMDSVGNTTAFTWSVAGLLTSVTDWVGRVTSLQYTSNRLQQVTDWGDQFVLVTHNSSGRLLTVSSPASLQMGPTIPPVMTYTYDTSGRLSTLTDTLNRVTTLSYSFAGRLSGAVLPGGATWAFGPVDLVGLVNPASGIGTPASPAPRTSPSQAIATWTNPLGGVRQLAVDSMGNIVRDVAPNGAETNLARNANGQVTSQTLPDPDGSGPLTSLVTTWAYDANGNVTQMVLPGGATRTWTWNTTLNKPLTETDEFGRTTQYSWNANRTLASQTLPTGQQIVFTRNSRGQVLTQTVPDPDGVGPLTAGLITTTYDTLGRTTSQTDASGATLTFGWDSVDRLISQTDPAGRTTLYSHTWMGRLASVTSPDPDGSGPLTPLIVNYNYDLLGRRTSESRTGGPLQTISYNTAGLPQTLTVADPDGTGPLTAAITTVTYDLLGQVISKASPGGLVESYTRNANGQILTITGTDPDGSGPKTAPVTAMTYDLLGRTTSLTDAEGGVTQFGWNVLGQQASVTNALGQTVFSTFSNTGLLLSSTNELGAVTQYTYDTLARLAAVTLPDPDGAGSLPAPVIATTYDQFGRTVSTTLPDGSIASVEYDMAGRIIRQVHGDGSFLTTVYDVAGQVTSQSTSDPDGAGPLTSLSTGYTYDALGRVTSSTSSTGGVSTWTYNALGQLASATDAAGVTVLLVYDGWGRVIQQTTPSGSSVTTYNAAGLTASIRDELNHQTLFSYDTAGRLTTRTDASGGVTSYDYDRLNRLKELTDAVGNTTTWTLNAIGLVVSETNESGHSRTFSYDAAGRLTQRTDRNGRIIEFVHDQLGRQTSQVWKDGSTVVNTITTVWNDDLRVASLSDSDSSYAFTWDTGGRLLTVSNTGTSGIPQVVLSSSYDLLGRETGLTATVGGIVDFVNAQTYDTAGRVSRITQADGSPSAGATVKNKRVDFTWDNANRLVSMSRFDSLDTSAAVAVTQNTYDTAGRTSSIQHQTGSTALAGYTFAWDAASRLTSVSSVRDGLTNYSHDATNQLTAADHTGQTDEVLSYDANGNRTSANGQSGFVTGTSNRTLTDGTYNYTYDLEGNRTSRTEIATGIKVEYSWNHANQLTKVTWRNAANAVTKTVEYRYDGLGRRIEKSVDENGNGTVDRREQYIYEGAGLLTASGGSVSISGPNGELNQHGWVDDVVLVLDGAGTIQHRYLHGPLIDQVFADETAGGEVLWALADHLGTVRDWARRADFDSNGTQETQVVNHVKFSAFGDVVSQTAGTTPPLHSYTGQLWDADADLMYYRARWYDPTLGRFVSEDPMGFEAGDANLSRYVGNSAPNATDPTGLDEKEKHPLWPYREAARQKGLPIGIIDSIIDKDPRHTVSVIGGSRTEYRTWWNDIVLLEDQHATPLSKWSMTEWPLFYNELWHAWWDFHVAEGRTRIYDQHIAPRTSRYNLPVVFIGQPSPFEAQEEAYSETVSAYILLVYQREALENMAVDLNKIVKDNPLKPVSHPETFGSAADDLYTTEEEFRTLILPVLEGTLKP